VREMEEGKGDLEVRGVELSIGSVLQREILQPGMESS